MDFLTKPPTWLTDQLPQEGRDFLTNGGWYAVLGVAGLLLLLVLYLLVRAVLPRSRPKAKAKDDSDLDEDLATYPALKHPPGAKRLTVEGVPVRVRLAVLAPAGNDLEVNPATTAKLLDRVVPGLGELATHDRARTRIWPAQLSYQGFANTFFRHVRRPGEEGEPSAWVLVAGRVKVGKQQVLVGLALYADEETTLDRRTLEPHEWPTTLRVRASKD
jgi:hypothetical protein